MLLVGVIAGTRLIFLVAEKKAPELFFRLRYSAQVLGYCKYLIHDYEYSKKSLVPAEIGPDRGIAVFKKTTKPKKQKI